MKLKTAIEYWEILFSALLTETKIVYMYDKYIQFLKQLLQLWMFIPCDKEGKPLDKPDNYGHPEVYVLDNKEGQRWLKECSEYQQACDRVLFKGFELLKSYKSIQGEMACELNKEIYFVDNVCFSSYDSVKTIEDISGKVDLVEKVAEKYKY